MGDYRAANRIGSCLMSFSGCFLFGFCFLLLVHPGMNRAIAEPRQLKGPKETIVALGFSLDGKLLVY
jgi:hypothetical protein